MPVGSCSCGAVYACDETGHNLGSAMIEALVFGCNMDWDLAWGLLPEEDYQEEIVEHYDQLSHLIIPGGFFERRRISGALYFIRMHEDVRDVTSDGVRKSLDKAVSGLSRRHTKNDGKAALSREMVEEFVRGYKISPILEVAGVDRKLLKNLQRLLYSGDDLIRQRAAEILGRVSAVVSERNAGVISSLLQRLFISITDTAASNWGAFEAIGEIISRRIDLYAGYIPQLYQFLGDETRRGQVLQTIEKIARARPELIRKYAFHFIPFLSDPEPGVRGYAASLLGALGAQEAKEDVGRLLEDLNEIHVYENGNLTKKKVGQIASEVIVGLSAV